jgi:hypothetical protein
MRNGFSTNRQRHLATYQGIGSGPDPILLRMGSQGHEEAVRYGAGAGKGLGSDGGTNEGYRRPFKQAGKLMVALCLTSWCKVREWGLIAAVLVLFVMTIYPVIGVEVWPVLDTKGGNLMSMEVERLDRVYHPGEMVVAQFIFQKERAVTGQIKWELMPSPLNPDAKVVLYPARVVAGPVGFVNHFANVERLDEDTKPGWYKFRGTITYPLVIGTVPYQLQTVCFEVRK